MAQTGSLERIVPSGFHAADVHGWVLRVEKHFTLTIPDTSKGAQKPARPAPGKASRLTSAKKAIPCASVCVREVGPKSCHSLWHSPDPISPFLQSVIFRTEQRRQSSGIASPQLEETCPLPRLSTRSRFRALCTVRGRRSGFSRTEQSGQTSRQPQRQSLGGGNPSTVLQVLDG